jgi:hypothetical protein
MRWIVFILAAVVFLSIAAAEEQDAARLWEPLDPFKEVLKSPSETNPTKAPSAIELSKDATLSPKWLSDRDTKSPLQSTPSQPTQPFWSPLDSLGANSKGSAEGKKKPTAAERTKGTWRDPEQLTVKGAKRFKVEEIRDGLMNCFEVWDAVHPLAAPYEYPKLLAERCREGYRHAGFSEVQVEGRFSDDYSGVVLTIQEGPESFCGNVKIEGALHFQPHELAKWLTNKQPPAGARPTSFADTEHGTFATWVYEDGSEAKLEEPAWEVAMPVRGDELGRQKLEATIARGLAELGLPWAKFEWSLTDDKKPNFKELQIKIAEEGPLAIAEEIEVVGNERDSADDIIKYLGVDRGVVLRDSLRMHWYHKLWMSGRFLSQNVELVPPTPFGDPAKLRITVSEYEPATPLKQPLSEIETVLMKCRDWLLDGRERKDDLVLRLSGDIEACLVASADDRALIHVKSWQPPWCEEGPTIRNVVTSMSSGKWVLATENCPKTFAMLTANGRLCVNFGMQSRPDPDNDEKHRFSMKFGLGITSAKSSLWSFNIAPVAILSLAHDDNATYKMENEILSISEGKNEEAIRINCKTGELLDYKGRLTETGDNWFEFGLKHGAFDPIFSAADNELENRLSGGESAYRPNQPISSAVEYLLSDEIVEILTSEDRLHRIAKIARKATVAGLLHPVDEWWLNAENQKKDDAGKFKVPAKPGTTPDDINNVSAIVAMTMAAISERGVAEDSWPAILLRVAAEISLNHTKYVNDDLRMLINCNDFGPLGHLAAAELLRSGGPDTAAFFAKYGLTKLSAEDFAKDCEPLGNSNTYAGKFGCHIATILRELSDEESDELGELLLGENGSVLTKVVQELRKHRDGPVEEALPAVAQVAWKSGLRAVVENRLRELAGEAVAAKPAEGDSKKQ